MHSQKMADSVCLTPRGTPMGLPFHPNAALPGTTNGKKKHKRKKSKSTAMTIPIQRSKTDASGDITPPKSPRRSSVSSEQPSNTPPKLGNSLENHSNILNNHEVTHIPISARSSPVPIKLPPLKLPSNDNETKGRSNSVNDIEVKYYENMQ